ncbi:MAG: TonB-dependent siderophore receptor [Cyanobacteria bacterium P01_D01_bin.56]
MLNRLPQSLAIASLFSVPILPAWAETVSTNAGSLELNQLTPDQPATTVVDWIAQIEAAQVQITGVRLDPTEAGLQVVLETAGGELTTPTTTVSGNALIAEIPNAVLALPEGEDFQQFEPADDIALVQVTQLPNDRVQVAITGVEAAPTAEVSLGATGLTLSAVPAIAQAGETDDVLRVVVTGDEDEGYNPSNSSTATGTDTPLRDIPLSIQVIPQAVLEDRNVIELGDALETAGSVVEAGGRATSVFGPNFLIRGFPVADGIFRDGVSAFSLAPLTTNDIERVEVLRGPASILFGQGEPGGIINLVSKRPLSEPFYEVSTTVGSFETYSGALDLSGPLNEDRSIRYRLNFSYENYGSFVDFVDGERLVVSPIITWDIGPDTSLDIYGQYISERETTYLGVPASGDGIVDVPPSRFLGEEFGDFSQEQFNVGYRLNHAFNENLSLHHSLQYLQFEPERYGPLFTSFNEATGELERLEYITQGTYRRLFTNAELVGEFETGSIQHRTLFGVEYRYDAEAPTFRFDRAYPSINVFNPIYTGIPYSRETNFFRDDNVDTISVYLQDQIEIIPELQLLAGVRYNYINQFRTVQNLGSSRNEFETTDSELTPRFGVVYQPIEPLSIYASYTTSFSPSFGANRNFDGSAFEAETGRQFEVGVKADLSDQFSLNLAAFDILRQNVSNPDPNNPTITLQTGEIASRGIELYVGGEILPGWNITSAYTYLDAFVSKDTRNTVGNRLANVPENQFSLWTTYEVQEGDLAGLGAGLGLFYVGARQGDLNNTFTIPSYFRTDAALFYKRDDWQVQLNFENLFNVEYFTGATSRTRVLAGSPFGVSTSFSISF